MYVQKGTFFLPFAHIFRYFFFVFLRLFFAIHLFWCCIHVHVYFKPKIRLKIWMICSHTHIRSTSKTNKMQRINARKYIKVKMKQTIHRCIYAVSTQLWFLSSSINTRSHCDACHSFHSFYLHQNSLFFNFSDFVSFATSKSPLCIN